MYDQHFGLTGRPFQLTPDPAFWYETATHRRAMAYLGYGLAQGEGFIVITGDIGAGKTTLIGHLLATLDHDAVNPIRIVSSAVEAKDLLRIVAAGLGVEATVAIGGLDKAGLLAAIERGLHAVARTGRRTLVIVDEAQALPADALEELRMLSNFQAGGHALIQIVLLGQPEFRELLRTAPGLEQLRQRVIATHHLDPMAADEVAPYIAHRLGVVGWRGRPDFAADAFDAFHAASGGVPRRLNALAGRVMLHAAVEGLALIDARAVALVAADLAADLPGTADGTAAEPVRPAIAPAEPVAVPRWMALDEAVNPAKATGDPAPATIVPLRSWTSPAADKDADRAGGDTVAEMPSVPVPEEQDLHPRLGEGRGAASAASALPTDLHPVAAMLAADRFAALEQRLEEQDATLRRVLTLLVDWVERDADPRQAVAA